MKEQLEVVDEAVPYILLQRTETQSKLRKLRYILPKGRQIYNKVYNGFLYRLEAQLRGDEVKEEYLDKLEEEYRWLKPYLPENPDRLLDIGCGVGGLELFLSEHYEEVKPEYYLLDKTEVSEQVYYQFEDKGAYYNSLQVANEMLKENEVDEGRIRLLEVEQTEVKDLPPVDLCFSFLSWAFHYPLSTYLDEVLQILKPEGRLILDFRRETGERAECSRCFEEEEVIKKTDKYTRTMFRGPREI